jgi:hypothetical protein
MTFMSVSGRTLPIVGILNEWQKCSTGARNQPPHSASFAVRLAHDFVSSERQGGVES